MKASPFPREYIAYGLDDKVFYDAPTLIAKGFTLSADGLPYYHSRPFDCVILWYSGQKDSKGTKLYEGDICKMSVLNDFGSLSEAIGMMRWDQQNLRFIMSVGYPKAGVEFHVKTMEKIGHEFTHPELFQQIINNAKQK